MNTTNNNPLDLLNSLQSVRKLRRTPVTSTLRKEIEAINKRLTIIEQIMLVSPVKEEPQIPEGFYPIHHYFDLMPEVSETQVRKLLDDGVLAGTVEVGTWLSKKTKRVCKWYRQSIKTQGQS